MRCHSHPFLSLLLGFVLAGSGLSQAQEKIEDTTLENPKPADLSLRRLDDSIALISGYFPLQEPGRTLEVIIEGKPFTLSDNGEGGDERAGDGWFSIKTEFDFQTFAEANRLYAELHRGKERILFAPGGRHQIGTQSIFVENEAATVMEHVGGKERRFSLPFSPDGIKFDVPIQLPVKGFPLGLPENPDFAAAASIPDSLMITKLDVVTDPDRTWSCSSTNQQPVGNPVGEWTFWQLMGNINNGTASTSDYIKALFDHWNGTQTINGQTVPARSHVFDEVIGEWEIRSGGPGATLLPQHSPFKLLGIVLRLDLRGGSTIYGGGDAGEGRFVFSLHDGNCNSLGKTLILEYKVPISGCANVRDWAQQWKALAGSANYNSDLAALTEVFSAAGANPSAPNGSAISQVRTNEFLPISPEWELREFILPAGGGHLEQTTVKQEPQEVHNNSPLLADYVNQEWMHLVAQTHVVPELFNGNDFLAGRAPAPLLWNVPAAMLSIPNSPPPATPGATNTDEALFGLAVNTCSGCHTLETGTGFAHMHYNTQPGQEAILSGFLTGTSLPDPREPSIMRHFDDLARRADDLDTVAASACFTIGDVAVGNSILHELTIAPLLRAEH
ncbi:MULTISPECIES: hypothetical protein [unclassified Microbulbifer]|uniref:hypothetical protein n=1 Tax=unclassified Microbulbifer TaxID=2619833 RepID=UPI0027E4279D|nr:MULTISPECIES: hypothetical protein [unclassified Microbulbifer]